MSAGAGALSALALSRRTGDLSWQDRALCAGIDAEEFFPDKGGSTAYAKRVCRACPVRAECLDYAQENDEQWGIWGGLSASARQAVTRNRAGVTRQPGAPALSAAPEPKRAEL